jgi:putative FmdB family regulatory protein
MPLYEYRCIICQNDFEILKISMNDPKPRCPSCFSDKVQKKISISAVRPDGIPKGKGGFKGPACRPSGGGGGI